MFVKGPRKIKIGMHTMQRLEVDLPSPYLQLEPNQSFSAELCPGCSEGILLKNMLH